MDVKVRMRLLVYLLVLEISMNLYFVIELVSLFLVWLFELNAGIFIVLS
jgi:hypothetical protein